MYILLWIFGRYPYYSSVTPFLLEMESIDIDFFPTEMRGVNIRNGEKDGEKKTYRVYFLLIPYVCSYN